MKNKSLFTLIFTIILGLYSQANVTTDNCAVKNNSTRGGEKITYTVYYTVAGAWIGAGVATFTNTLTTYNDKKAYHIEGVGKTFKSYDWVFKVRDKYETYLDHETMQPLRFIRNVNEGGYKMYQNVQFYHKEKKIISNTGSFKMENCVQDVLSSMYFLRNINFNDYKVNDKIPFDMFLDDEIFHIYVRYMGKEKLKTKHGVFNTIKLKPMLVKGTIFEGGEKMNVWITDDDNKVPVYVETPILVGSIRVALTSHANLRNPTTGIISMK